jgi:UDP-glucose 4-epimerase
LAAYREYGLPVTIVRFFNTVGPGQTGRYGMVIPRFVRQAIQGEPITVYGDGNQTRCFCHVQDTIRALELLLDHHESTAGEIYNIGSNHEVTINELANEVITRSTSTSTVRLVPYSEAYAPGFEDMRRRVPDTTKIREAVGWQATRSLNEILDDVIAFERNRCAPVAVA